MLFLQREVGQTLVIEPRFTDPAWLTIKLLDSSRLRGRARVRLDQQGFVCQPGEYELSAEDRKSVV